MFIVDDKIQSITLVSCVSCYNYSTWKLLDWWLYIQSGLSYRCNPYVGVSNIGINVFVHCTNQMHEGVC